MYQVKQLSHWNPEKWKEINRIKGSNTTHYEIVSLLYSFYPRRGCNTVSIKGLPHAKISCWESMVCEADLALHYTWVAPVRNLKWIRGFTGAIRLERQMCFAWWKRPGGWINVFRLKYRKEKEFRIRAVVGILEMLRSWVQFSPK